MSKKENKTTGAPSYSSTLKSRRVETPEVKVVQKPRKMNLVKPKRQASKSDDFANSALLVFPTDPLGITTDIKSAMIKAGSKIGTDKKTLLLIDETLRILRGHIQARYNQNVNKPVLKQRVNTKPVEEVEEKVEETDEGPDYNEMVAALKEAGVKLTSRKKADVEAAYAELKGDE